MMNGPAIANCHRFMVVSAAAGVLTLAGLGCAGAVTPSNNDTPDGPTTVDDNVLLNDALDYEGSISGKVVDTQSTRDSTDSAAGQSVPVAFDTASTVVHFNDLAGNELIDPSGEPIPPVPVNPDGSFSADGLPVGTDFTICADIGRDGTCDIESSVNIPAASDGADATLRDVRVDPLRTIALAKLRRLLDERGIDLRDLPVSPVAIITRIVAAYVNLFEDAGIEDEITLEDIRAKTSDALAALFDSDIPATVQTGMHIVAGNLATVRAPDAETLALGVAEVFLRAGFPIADLPGGADLSPLGELDGITTTTRRELFGDMVLFENEDELLDGLADEFPDELQDLLDEYPDGPPEDLADRFPDGLPDDIPVGLLDGLPDGLLEGFFDDPAPQSVPDGSRFDEESIYISTLAEPDRNFSNTDTDEDEQGKPPLPVLTDHILVEMAQLNLDGRRITLAALYDLLTSLDNGMGLRLTYFVHDANFAGPPLTVFETADGQGLAINPERLFARFLKEDLRDVGRDAFEAREGELRALLRELLGDTLPPVFKRLFNGFTIERIRSAEDLAQRIRRARAHLPFNRTGPSHWFVVADGDSFRTDNVVSPVTVDADISIDGDVASVVYNAAGEGRFYLGFTGRTDEEGRVEFIVRETGRILHGARGPVRVSMFNDRVFQPVNGQPFAKLVSETGTFYPPIHVPVVRDERVAMVSTARELGGHDQILVLATKPGEGGEPVRVDYDFATGMATHNQHGRHLLMFLPDSQETGLFALFNESIGRPAGLDDPVKFFERPVDRPDGFEDLFNEVDDFGDRERLDDFLAASAQSDPLDNEQVAPVDNSTTEPVDGPTDPSADTTNAPTNSLDDTAPPDADSTAGQLVPSDDTTGSGGDAVLLVNADVVTTLDVNDVTDLSLEIEDVEDMEVEPDDSFRPDFILVAAQDVIGLDIRAELFKQVFGTDVPNERHDPASDPFFDDVNGNGVEDPGEPTGGFRPTLFDPSDWRSTDIRIFYRRADNGQSVSFDDVKFEADTPETTDGVALVRRNFLPRMNAFRFGRPNTAINLITAFTPPDYFDGTHSLSRDTRVNIFTAIAIINLVMDQVFNIEVNVDIDGFGPLPRQRLLMDARPFVVPMDDPFILLLKGFQSRSEVVRDSR